LVTGNAGRMARASLGGVYTCHVTNGMTSDVRQVRLAYDVIGGTSDWSTLPWMSVKSLTGSSLAFNRRTLSSIQRIITTELILGWKVETALSSSFLFPYVVCSSFKSSWWPKPGMPLKYVHYRSEARLKLNYLHFSRKICGYFCINLSTIFRQMWPPYVTVKKCLCKPPKFVICRQ